MVRWIIVVHFCQKCNSHDIYEYSLLQFYKWLSSYNYVTDTAGKNGLEWCTHQASGEELNQHPPPLLINENITIEKIDLNMPCKAMDHSTKYHYCPCLLATLIKSGLMTQTTVDPTSVSHATSLLAVLFILTFFIKASAHSSLVPIHLWYVSWESLGFFKMFCETWP